MVSKLVDHLRLDPPEISSELELAPGTCHPLNLGMVDACCCLQPTWRIEPHCACQSPFRLGSCVQEWGDGHSLKLSKQLGGDFGVSLGDHGQ